MAMMALRYTVIFYFLADPIPWAIARSRHLFFSDGSILLDVLNLKNVSPDPGNKKVNVCC
jgi:hypothetical protein